MDHKSGCFYQILFWLFCQCIWHSVLTIEELQSPKPKETLLMDSRETNWEGWTKNTPHNIGWRQQSRPGTGYRVYGLCEPVLRQPPFPAPLRSFPRQNDSFSDGEVGMRSEYWLFSPRIQLGRAISVHAQIFFMLRSCTDRELTHSLLGCREHFDLYLQKGTPTEGLEWDPEDEPTIKNFKKLATISSDTKWSADTSQSDAVTSWLIRFKPMSHQSWIRLAVRDEGACLMLDRIRIYYLSCPAWQVGFMRLPETAAGHDAEVREVQGECVHGARPKGANSNHTADIMTDVAGQLSGGLRPSFCKANGRWHVLAGSVCECLAGYEPSAESSACTACPISTYKLRPGVGVCHLCPPKSQTVSVASAVCDCDAGYFWHQKQLEQAKGDGDGKAAVDRDFGVCTQYLPTPSGLRVSMRDDRRLVLTWNVLHPPAGVGMGDVIYALRCPTCRKSVVTFSPGSVTNGTKVTVTGIGPEERHDFFVVACMGPMSAPVGCSEEPAEISITPKNANLRETLRDVKVESSDKLTSSYEEQSAANGLLTWFHIMLGIAIFVCMTLLFVFLAIILYRLARGRLKKRPTNPGISQASNSSYVKGFYNSLEQISLPVNSTFHRINSIDREAIEIDESLGHGHFGEVFRGHLLSNVAYFTLKEAGIPGYTDQPAQAISASTSPLHQLTSASTTATTSSFSCVSFAGLGSTSSTATARLPVFLRSVRLSASASPLRSGVTLGPTREANNDDEESLLLTSAHLSLHLRNPFLLACHGIVKSVQPHLFVYEFMQRGRLRQLLEKELREEDEALRNSNEYKSSLLSTKLLFKMLHQIVSGFEFLSQQHIPDLVLDSSSVLVGADYTCKLEIAFWRNCLRQKTRNSDGRASFYVNNLGSLNSELVGCLEVDDHDELKPRQNAANSQRTATISLTPYLTGTLISQTTFSQLKSLQNSPVRDSNTDSPLSLFNRLAKSVLRRPPPEALTDPDLNESSHVWCYGCIQLEVLLAGVLYQQRALRFSNAVAATDFSCSAEQMLGLSTTTTTCSSTSCTTAATTTTPFPQVTQDVPTKMRQPTRAARDDLLVLQGIACKLCTMEYAGKTSQLHQLAELKDMLVMFVCDWFANDFLSYLLRGCLQESPNDRPAFAEILRHLAKYAAENATLCTRPSYRMKGGHGGVLEQKHIPQETTIIVPSAVTKDTQVGFISLDETEPTWKGLLLPELHILGKESS